MGIERSMNMLPECCRDCPKFKAYTGRRQNLHRLLKNMVLEYIDETPNLPEHIKPQAKDLLIRQMNMVIEYLGVLELFWRREGDRVQKELSSAKRKLRAATERKDPADLALTTAIGKGLEPPGEKD